MQLRFSSNLALFVFDLILMISLGYSGRHMSSTQKNYFCIFANYSTYNLVTALLYTVSQKRPTKLPKTLTCERILIFFGRNITDKVSNQKTLYYATSNNLWFCTTW